MIQHDPLISLPTHILAHITGERRKRLLEYLLRWGEHAAALACLDGWLAGQPHLATLREARARVLIEQDRVQLALETLDQIDEERGMSESRRALRMRGLAALGRWDAAHALLPEHLAGLLWHRTGGNAGRLRHAERNTFASRVARLAGVRIHVPAVGSLESEV